MGEIVNLRQMRKRAGRKAREAAADANRIAFGTPKRLRDQAGREADRADARLEGHRLDRPTQPED